MDEKEEDDLVNELPLVTFGGNESDNESLGSVDHSNI